MGDILKWCRKHKVRMVSFWAFSTENFKRDHEEVEGLMREFGSRLQKVMEEADFEKYDVRVRFVGDRALFPYQVQAKMGEIERKTAHHGKYFVNLFIGYGGRPELVAMAKKIAKDYAGSIGKIDEAAVERSLWTAGIPDPDLIIRTSGEQRISGFLPFQSAYSELHFSKKLWPDFGENDFKKAIADYKARKRRWGK